VDDQLVQIWQEDASVLLTSFWGWTPEDWACVGWTGNRGLTYRNNLMQQLTDPFITVVYVTGNKSFVDPDLKGKLAGFMLVSHQTGDRDEFTHPRHHNRDPSKWRHSLRANRTFTFLPEYRPTFSEIAGHMRGKERAIGYWGKLLEDRSLIEQLRSIPVEEVACYNERSPNVLADNGLSKGMVRAGPAPAEGYSVAEGCPNSPRELYVLKLDGPTDKYLGRSADGRSIFKVGLAISPDMRRQSLQKAMPKGAFTWTIERTTRSCGLSPCDNHQVAVAGEDAMKHVLARDADWLQGEFYLADRKTIERAWQAGLEAAGKC
jgi:hypothetical protein